MFKCYTLSGAYVCLTIIAYRIKKTSTVVMITEQNDAIFSYSWRLTLHCITMNTIMKSILFDIKGMTYPEEDFGTKNGCMLISVSSYSDEIKDIN